MTDSINQLITLCTQQAPGQKECDNALRELEVNMTFSTKSKRREGQKCLAAFTAGRFENLNVNC